MIETQINTIEGLVAHQEQQIQDLSDMVARQWDEIDRLKKRMERLQNKLNVIEEGAQDTKGEPLSVTEAAARDKPPHY